MYNSNRQVFYLLQQSVLNISLVRRTDEGLIQLPIPTKQVRLDRFDRSSGTFFYTECFWDIPFDVTIDGYLVLGLENDGDCFWMKVNFLEEPRKLLAPNGFKFCYQINLIG